MDEVWAARDTTPSKVEQALRDLVARRHQQSEGAYVPARTLNLVVIVDRDFRGEVENRLEPVERENPSRVITCAVEPGRRTLDAWASMVSETDTPQAGIIAVAHERVRLSIGERHLRALDTIVDPLLVSDISTVVWAPHGHGEGIDALRRLAQIVLVDTHDEPDVRAALARSGELARWMYVVDLAWLRSTPWRERIAAAFDPPPLRRWLAEISTITVRHRHDSVAAAVLFCGWLCSRLGWRPGSLSGSRTGLRGRARARRQEVTLALEPVEQGAPGLAGITVTLASGASLSLDRGRGGLTAVRRARDGSEQTWTVLGASRGEQGILGDGVRQALLSDPTYTPALAAAQAMVS
jgi:glucose-6-phosphate dehydrogenase assembly protein OpcA